MVSPAAATQPSVTDWIQAFGTLVLIPAGLVVTVLLARLTAFRPGAVAVIDKTRTRLGVRIWNRGNTAGMVDRVDVVPAGHALGSTYDVVSSTIWAGSDRAEDPLPFLMPEGGIAYLVLLAEDGQFPPGVGVTISYGTGQRVCIVPRDIPAGTLELRLRLPPGN